MANESILVVSNAKDIIEQVRFNLSQEKYRIFCAETYEKAMDILQINIPDLIILDFTLPEVYGLEMVSRLKANDSTRDIPIVMLAEKTYEDDVVAGLEMGVEEYVSKPFNPQILAAIIKTVMRRHGKSPREDRAVAIQLHDIVIFPWKHEVLVNGKHIYLTATEFDVLNILAGRPGWVFTRSRILELLKGDSNIVKNRTVDTQVVGLRKKLGTAGKYVETVRSVGYRFRD